MSTTGSTPLPISSLIGVNQPTSSTASTSSGSTLGPDAFLQLLTAELQNQDPTQPSDPTQSVTQLAQMSQLQYQQQLTSSFQNFHSKFGVKQAASLIGKQASVQVTSSTGGNSSTVTGTIQSIEVQNGSPYFTMTDSSGKVYTDNNGNPLLFSTSEIIGIGTTSSSTTGSTTPTSGS
jgi:flagellar basal-body rod modification protein FlgD